MDELKPCPFCGGNAGIVFSGQQYTNGQWKGYIVAQCETCAARAKGAFYQGKEIEIPLEETHGGYITAKAWNRRTQLC